MKKYNKIKKITTFDNQIIGQDKLYDMMLNALIIKYGLILTSAQVAEVLGISTRTLDERRKAGKDCPCRRKRKTRSLCFAKSSSRSGKFGSICSRGLVFDE